MFPRGVPSMMKRSQLLSMAFFLAAGCSFEPAQLQPTERAVQPTVNAFECGGTSVKETIASCRAEGGNYGHCAVVAWHTGVSDATACYNYSTKIHRLREQLVGQEDQLDAQIHYLQDVNTDTEKLNADLATRVDAVTQRTDIAVDTLARGKMTASDLEQLRSILDNEASYAERQLDTASRQLEVAERYRSQQQPATAALDAQIARLKALLEETQRQTRALMAQRQRI
jgi:hypothetical protein